MSTQFSCAFILNRVRILTLLMLFYGAVGHAQSVDRMPERRWIDAQSQQPMPWSVQAVRQLSNAASDGLSPQDYQAEVLKTALESAMQMPLSTEDGAKLDARINQAVMRYLKDLYYGRIDPKTIRENYSPDARPVFDVEDVLNQALSTRSLEFAWKAAQPPVPMYLQLREQLQRYLRLRNDPAWSEQLPVPAKGKTITSVQEWPGQTRLMQRLVLLGDMPETVALNQADFESALETGLVSFQSRHALNPTGRIDRATIEQINVSPAERADQIARTMERLRWAPLYQKHRMIVVNIPEYHLRAYTLTEDGKVQDVLPISVIVGKANSTRTPLFNKDMVRVEFSPYWNVPLSITRKEMVPRLQRDPDYARRNNFEILGSDGTPVEVTSESITALNNGSMRIRQRPGRGNALGDVKFIFPNKDNIYLHHTSAPGLFNRNDRALSHGCVRVQDPVALAKFVLEGDPQWTEPRIRHVMDKRISATVQIKPPIPVIITYLNTVIDEEGKLKFAPDIYGQDQVLKRALQQRSRT